MAKERKIALVAKKLSFKEAEEADDKYWAEKSAEYRLRALMDLREMVFGNIKEQSIKKVVYKRSLHEEIIGHNELLKVKQKAGRPQDLADINKLKSRNKKK
jgi:hypothetical protein